MTVEIKHANAQFVGEDAMARLYLSALGTMDVCMHVRATETNVRTGADIALLILERASAAG